jgi:hypothetical protein
MQADTVQHQPVYVAILLLVHYMLCPRVNAALHTVSQQPHAVVSERGIDLDKSIIAEYSYRLVHIFTSCPFRAYTAKMLQSP